MVAVNVCILALLATEDILSKRLYFIHILAGGVIMTVCAVIANGILPTERLGGMAIGVIMIALSKLTRGDIGLADGMVFCMTGLALGFSDNFYLLACTVFGAGIFAVVMCITRKMTRKDSFPLVPFILCGYMCVMLFK